MLKATLGSEGIFSNKNFQVIDRHSLYWSIESIQRITY